MSPESSEPTGDNASDQTGSTNDSGGGISASTVAACGNLVANVISGNPWTSFTSAGACGYGLGPTVFNFLGKAAEKMKEGDQGAPTPGEKNREGPQLGGAPEPSSGGDPDSGEEGSGGDPDGGKQDPDGPESGGDPDNAQGSSEGNGNLDSKDWGDIDSGGSSPESNENSDTDGSEDMTGDNTDNAQDSSDGNYDTGDSGQDSGGPTPDSKENSSADGSEDGISRRSDSAGWTGPR
jgi:hypothetical protein